VYNRRKECAMRGKEDHGRERQLRKDQTEAEALLWSRLRNRRLENFKFRRQHRIGSYFADFVCSEHRLIIELDGGQHVDQARYDEARTRFLEAQGYRVLRFWNSDLSLCMDEVLDEVLRVLHTPHPAAAQPPSPRSGARVEPGSTAR
jgi:very-short-patch-repair endonuclease